jgi:hypothetical protein
VLVEWILVALLASTCLASSPLLALRVGLRPALAPTLLSLIDRHAAPVLEPVPLVPIPDAPPNRR